MLLDALNRFFRHDAAGGVLLILSALAAMIAANSVLEPMYAHFLGANFAITLDGAGLGKPLLLWINDGLMAVFFFLIGLELKRELLEGRLKKFSDVMLPGLAAVGGMAVPAIIFVALNWGSAETLRGWAIPSATDIAFALGVLALLGTRAPVGLKLFLLTLAILDDMGAIVIIALFYTSDLNLGYIALALLPIAGMFWQNRRGAHRVAPTLILGTILWVLVLKSGIHATLAGVLTAFFIPLTDRTGKSPLHALETALAPYVLYLIVPLFAFANAGVALLGLSPRDLIQPLPLGVAAGLVLGKQLGVFGATWIVIRLGLGRLPEGVRWVHIYGLACLAGIGFTMSLFIGGLSFQADAHMNAVRLGVLAGSIISAVLGYGVLFLASTRTRPRQEGPGART